LANRLGICVFTLPATLTLRILAFSGPYKGAAADVTVFRSTIKPLLKPRERLMADKGYSHDESCWCPPRGKYSQFTVEQKIERRRVTVIRHLNERAIGRLVGWGIFKRRWHSKKPTDHKLAAHASAKLTQLLLYHYPLT
jgi:hypothetical protein